jgi:hypothetical protein
MGEGLLLGLSWLDGSVSAVLSERKVVKVSSILCRLSNHVEVNFFYLISVLVPFLFSSGLIRLLDFLIYSVITVSTVFFVVKILFFFFFSSLFYKRCVFIRLLYLSPVCLFGVCWVRGNFLAGRVIYFLCVCGSAVWSAGPVQFYLGTFMERMAGLYRFFLFSCCVVAGTVRLKW